MTPSPLLSKSLNASAILERCDIRVRIPPFVSVQFPLLQKKHSLQNVSTLTVTLSQGETGFTSVPTASDSYLKILFSTEFDGSVDIVKERFRTPEHIQYLFNIRF